MFEDKEWIKRMINMRNDNQIVIPLYIQIYGKKYSLLEMDKINKRFSESAFKIGYGTADGLFMNNSFPTEKANEFNIINSFSQYDNDKDVYIRYTVFESGMVEDDDNKLYEEINMWFNRLFNHVKDIVDSYFKSLISEENVPIIPKEEPKKEDSKFNEGIREYSGELSNYSSSWNPEFVNEETLEEDDIADNNNDILYASDNDNNDMDDVDNDSVFDDYEYNEDDIYTDESSDVTMEFDDDDNDDSLDEDFSTDFDIF